MSERIETAVSGVTLRFAGPDDVSQILRFIHDLADYERMSDDVVADETTLRRSLFGDRRVAEVVLAEEGGTPVGFALFFHNFSTFLGRAGIYLEDLFVPLSERGRGIGRALLAFLARLTVERGCGRLEWCVLDWNEPAIGFYEKLGAKAMDEWTTFRMDGDELEALAREG